MATAKTGKLHVEKKGRGNWAWSVRVGKTTIASGTEPRQLAAENAARTAATKKAPGVTFTWNPHPPKGETCGPGTIPVKRKAYTRKGKGGRRIRVGAAQFCIVDQGTPGKTSFGAKGPGALRPGTKPLIGRKGSLGEGFLKSMTDKQREAAIRRALKHSSYASVMGKLVVLALSSEIKKKYGAKLERAKAYLRSLKAKAEKKKAPKRAAKKKPAKTKKRAKKSAKKAAKKRTKKAAKKPAKKLSAREQSRILDQYLSGKGC